MVHAVETVVKGKPIQHLAGEVACMIIGVIHVAAVVLPVVDADDTPNTVMVRNKNENDEGFPVQIDQYALCGKKHDEFGYILPVPRWFLFAHSFGKRTLIAHDIKNHAMKKE